MKRSMLFAALLLVTMMIAPSVASSAAPTRVYWGAEIRGSYGTCPYEVSACTTFEQHAGKHMSAPRFGWSVENHDGSCATVPTNALRNARSRGYLPSMNLGWQRAGASGTDSNWQLRDVTNGAHDDCFHKVAHALDAFGTKVLLRGPWEPNLGGQYPWGTRNGWNGNAASDFIPAWRHVVRLFDNDGATNVIWQWAMNVDPNHRNVPLEQLYPGADFVDWVALDGYNQTGGDTFNDRFASTYDRVRNIAPGKPFSVAETGSIDGGSVSSVEFINGMFAAIAAGRYPNLILITWSNYLSGQADWRIEKSSARQNAFRQGISNSRYKTVYP